jgi:uncharacterized membrane protein (DUF485 family)
MAENKNQGVRENSAVVTARRALGLGKTYIFLAIFITIIRLTAINPAFLGTIIHVNGISSVSSELFLFSVPFDVLPVIMLLTPIVVLFVYDKNNGVLEYVLSLGMTPRDIYLRYLYAALLIACAYLIILIAANTLFLYASSGISSIVAQLPTLAIGVIIAFSIVAFVITVMMAFSVLQKSRAGGNQPLAMTLGAVGVIPTYFLPFLFPFDIAILIEIGEATILALIALAVILLSSRLIKREKLLP